MTDLLSLLTGSLWPALVAMGGVIATALGIYAKGRRDNAGAQEREQMEQELEAHDRINDADTGVGASDAERIKRLRKMADDWSD